MRWVGKGRGDVPRAWAAALEQVLEAKDPTGQVAAFVLTGQPADALTTLKGGNLRMPQAYQRNVDAVNKATVTLYAGFGGVDAAVLRRWGRVLDAPRMTNGWGLAFGEVAGCHWPELMLKQAVDCVPPGAQLPFTFADLERIAAEDGTSAAELVRMAFTLGRYHRVRSRTECDYLSRLPGFAEAVAAHRDIAGSTLVSGSVDERIAAASLLAVLGDPVLSVLAEPLAEAATATSAQVRAATRPLIDRIDAPAVDPLRRLATEGDPERRAYALELLAAHPDQHAWALQTAANDRAASVRALSAHWGGPPREATEEILPELPPLPSWSIPAAEAERIADQVFEGIMWSIESYNSSVGAPQRHLAKPPPGTVAQVAQLLAADAPARVDVKLNGIPATAHLRSRVASVIQQQECTATTAVQLMAVMGWLNEGWNASRARAEVVEAVHARTDGPDLLTWQRMFDAVGADGRALVWSAYNGIWGVRPGLDWPADHVWPFVAHNLDWILAESWSRPDWRSDEDALFAAVAALPSLPARLVDHLYSLAWGTRKSDRALAQAALERDLERTVRAIAALQDGKADVRLVAAQWLAQIADPSAQPGLSAAWKKEKQDLVRGALLDALIAIGEDTETYLDPATTAADAAKFVAKGLPAGLSWLDWEALPELTWASSGEPVPRAVVQWLCGTAMKAKSPEPNAVLRHYAALFDPAARERLAAYLLAAWLGEDLRQIPAGSAIATKGLLAVVAACGGREVVPPSERYLKEWYGQRAAQGRALIAMLAWVDHPNATQLVLAIGSRFRTKSFQEEAIRQAEALAARNGWTVDELADRTIPTAGFDEEGLLELPYGPRAFTAVLQPDLTIELRDPDGKLIKALPAPRQSDDDDQAKESKKAFSAAKKDLKSIATLQAQRLYEAMCTERSWSAEDWDRYLLRHPVVGPAVRRLVWVATWDDSPDHMIFRPLGDGSLTDVDDNDVKLPAAARIRVAHDSVLSSADVAQWAAHLADYEITPLFQQLGRGVHAITPQMRSKRELTDFTGHLLEAFALRGRAGKLGYNRGQAQDGGCFYTYEKRFPTLGITATVNFSGNPLPEENRLVALKELTFRRETADGRHADLTLGDVPAVLFSECWHDLRLLAAEGTGFDPQWEKRLDPHY